ncbi:MAG TPA: methyltransferase, partial [Geobacteraceae bacterium]|nr:methyltransferase [Geobacteraceae bacterium]
MMKRLSRFMSVQSSKPRSPVYRLWALSCGSLFFLVLVPLLLGAVARFLVRSIKSPFSRPFEIAFGASMICLGLLILFWAVSAFWRLGDGTPAPVAAPRRLVARGPYRYCRNPIQLGAIIYFLGLGCA